MSALHPNWLWSPEQIADLTASWIAGEPSASIGARLKRTSNAICGKASELKLPRRKQADMNQKGRPGGTASGKMAPEVPAQAAAWAGVRFDDAAVRSEGMLRGLPPINISPQSTTAAFAAGE